MIGEGSAKISEIITSPGEGVSPIRNSKISDCESERLPELSPILFEKMVMRNACVAVYLGVINKFQECFYFT